MGCARESEDEDYNNDDSDRFWETPYPNETRRGQPHTFGVELEMIDNDHNSGKMQRDGWCCEEDGSLNTDGVEFVSPILKGATGLKELQAFICNLHETGGFSVDDSCGLHVHLGLTKGQRNNANLILGLVQGFQYAEKWIYSILPASRRTNNYSKPINAFFFANNLE